MRNLSYREAGISLALIAAATLVAYRLWFVPALAQIERDRQTLEQLVFRAARPPRTPATATPATVACAPPLAARLDAPRAAPKPRPLLKGRASRRPALDVACADERDPLCGALDP